MAENRERPFVAFFSGLLPDQHERLRAMLEGWGVDVDARRYPGKGALTLSRYDAVIAVAEHVMPAEVSRVRSAAGTAGRPFFFGTKKTSSEEWTAIELWIQQRMAAAEVARAAPEVIESPRLAEEVRTTVRADRAESQAADWERLAGEYQREADGWKERHARVSAELAAVQKSAQVTTATERENARKAQQALEASHAAQDLAEKERRGLIARVTDLERDLDEANRVIASLRESVDAKRKLVAPPPAPAPKPAVNTKLVDALRTLAEVDGNWQFAFSKLVDHLKGV